MKFRIVKEFTIPDFIATDKANTPIPAAQLAPKVGDIIEGELVGTGPDLGMNYKVMGETIFIPADSLAIVDEVAPPSGIAFNAWTFGGFALGIGIGFGMYKLRNEEGILRLLIYCAIWGGAGIGAGFMAQKLKQD